MPCVVEAYTPCVNCVRSLMLCALRAVCERDKDRESESENTNMDLEMPIFTRHLCYYIKIHI